ncbi:UbiD family decarboxylase [Candidatus Bathyarchaeota archaeon]|nr:UbiD family decarboxylase [Candidatus Bathyarchaeota archaeon]
MVDLRSFIDILERESELHRIDRAVSPRFEASSIMKENDRKKAILFQISGYGKAVSGICGTKRRLALSLDTTPDRLRGCIMDGIRNPQQPSVSSNLNATEELSDLSKLPALTHFEKDSAPYLTSAIVSARLPDSRGENVSIHRLMIIDKMHMAIRIVPRHLYQICRSAEASGHSTVDVGIALGLHPAVLLAAASPAPFGVSEYAVANRLLGNKLMVAECSSVNARVPVDAEIVIEGKILLKKEVDEGPFVDITGTYDIVRKQPVVEVERILCRKDFIYHALLPSGREHGLLMGLPQEARIAESIAGVVPRVKDVNLTAGGCHWLHAAVSVEKQSEGDAKNAILAAFAGHPSLKHVVVVDPDIDVNNLEEVEWAIATRFQGSRGLVVITDARGSSLDASGNQELSLTTKVGIDATRSFLRPKEKFERAMIPADPKE